MGYKIMNTLIGIIGICFAVMFIYKAFAIHEGLLSMVLRLSAALIWLIVGILCYKDRNLTPNDQVRIWFNKQRGKGNTYYIIKHGVLYWGVFVGYVTWIFTADFQEPGLLKDALLHIMMMMVIGGIVIGYQGWNRHEKDALKFGLYEIENNENPIQQKKV